MTHRLIKCCETLSRFAPERLISLQDDRCLTAYLHSLTAAGQEPEQLLADSLVPSPYDYLAQVLAEEFEVQYWSFIGMGILPYELINLSAACSGIFDEYGFPAYEHSRNMYYRIVAAVAAYLEGGTQDGI